MIKFFTSLSYSFLVFTTFSCGNFENRSEFDVNEYVELDTYDQPDAIAPPEPMNVSCQQEGSLIRLSWELPSEVKYHTVKVYRWSQLVLVLPGNCTTVAVLHKPGENVYDIEGIYHDGYYEEVPSQRVECKVDWICHTCGRYLVIMRSEQSIWELPEELVRAKRDPIEGCSYCKQRIKEVFSEPRSKNTQ